MFRMDVLNHLPYLKVPGPLSTRERGVPHGGWGDKGWWSWLFDQGRY